MDHPASSRAGVIVSAPGRRASLRLSYANAAAWGLGNGLVSSTLVIYLGLELGAKNTALAAALILSAPQFLGLLRFSAPALIDRLADRKTFCVGCYAASALLLLLLPWAAAPGRLATPERSLVAMVAIWSLYHLLEYLGTVTLWSWLADLVPGRIRGAFIGHRERWLLVGTIVGMVATGIGTYLWRSHIENSATWNPGDRWLGYAAYALLGALAMLAATIPLMRMATVTTTASRPADHVRRRLAELLAPLGDARYWHLLLFGCTIAFFNGLTQSIQFLYPAAVLGLSLFAMLTLRSTMRLGQIAISPTMGRLADRFGNRPVMIACQAIVATGPAFYLLATSQAPWFVAGAWLAWIAYAGLNVCLPNLMIKLATPHLRAAYIAAYFAITGLTYGLATVVGGWLVDTFRDERFYAFGTTQIWGIYDLMFFLGWIGRTGSVVLLFMVIEPGAKPLSQLLRGEPQDATK
ncbi:MAG: MFS transporter [Planctomycetota bacterium]|nr:MAG: MFS transporter [Planctomycetota bacterium]REJ92716.1 MAG: MFS transporter [Planctomycetota bacterium]REK23754.1 MAG: MFS transporter [Planctomycetota bacterium]REK47607.1 MAG: MFS transporter [Planctomycetota bacterium]